MNRLRPLVFVLVSGFLTFGWDSAGQGAEKSWWNPLGLGSSSKPAGRSATGSRAAIPQRKVSNSGSSWDRMSKNTNQFFAKSRDALWPWGKSKSSGAGSGSSAQNLSLGARKPAPAKKSWFPAPFDEEPSREPRTPAEWVGGEKPRF